MKTESNNAAKALNSDVHPQLIFFPAREGRSLQPAINGAGNSCQGGCHAELLESSGGAKHEAHGLEIRKHTRTNDVN